MDLVIYTKEKCQRCKAMLSFLNKNKLSFTEKNIEDKNVIRKLLKSEYIVNNFCDENLCFVITPVIKLNGKWMHKEFFDVNGLNEKNAKNFLLKNQKQIKSNNNI
ncbi:MAG: glutaredoxin family protein [Candidatus Helarchaeota archaeon]